MKALVVCLCACLLLPPLQGCGMPANTSDALPLGSHKVSVRPYCISKQIRNRFPGTDKIYNLTCGQTEVTIKNEELIVNGKSYGMLQEADSIHVEDGKVFVNSREVAEAAQR